MNPTFIHQLNDALKYSHDNAANLLGQLAKPEHNQTRWGGEGADQTFRGVLADALDESDRPTEAALLRDPDQHVLVEGGRVVPGAWKYRQGFYADNDPELEEMVNEHGLEATMHHIRDNYDYGSGPLIDTSSGGAGEYRHRDGDHDGEYYMIGHHPGLGYVYTEHRMEVPADATYALEGGKFLHAKS